MFKTYTVETIDPAEGRYIHNLKLTKKQAERMRGRLQKTFINCTVNVRKIR